MNISAICKTKLASISAEANLQQASILLKTKSVGSLIICDKDDLPIGIVTDRDLATRGMAEGTAPDCVSVRSVMSHIPITASEDTDIFELIKIMEKAKVRRVIVVKKATGKMHGVISADDVLICLANQLNILSQIYQIEQPHGFTHDFSQMA